MPISASYNGIQVNKVCVPGASGRPKFPIMITNCGQTTKDRMNDLPPPKLFKQIRKEVREARKNRSSADSPQAEEEDEDEEEETEEATKPKKVTFSDYNQEEQEKQKTIKRNKLGIRARNEQGLHQLPQHTD